jgi:dipeptide/tripeptide permease
VSTQITDTPKEAPVEVPTGHPPAFWFIFWGEFAERCSYYGMRAILYFYLTQALLFPEGEGKALFSYFKSACYFLPLLGGYLADRYFGKYWTIVGFSVPYVLGHFVLGIETNPALFIALALLAGGSGVIKPNISTLMGKTYDQQRPGQKALLTSAFVWFYFSINVGSTLSLFFLPQLRTHYVDAFLARYDLKEEARSTGEGGPGKAWFVAVDGERRELTPEVAQKVREELGLPPEAVKRVRKDVGLPEEPAEGERLTAQKEAQRLEKELTVAANRYAYPLAFRVPAWLMVAALAAFALGKRFYAVEVIDRTQTLSPEERAARWAVLKRLLGMFALFVFFWVAYEQNDNIWSEFANDHIVEKVVDPQTGKVMATCVLRLGSWETSFPPDGFQWMNAALIIILVPLFGLMWRKLDPRGTRIPATRKIFVGFLWTAAAAGVMALASFQAQGGEKVSAWWMVLSYFALTLGEILLYGTGLELSYTAAPQSMKGFVTACFLVTNALGNIINSQLSPYYKDRIAEGPFFILTAGIVIAAAIAFIYVGRQFDRRRQDAPSTAIQA